MGLASGTPVSVPPATVRRAEPDKPEEKPEKPVKPYQMMRGMTAPMFEMRWSPPGIITCLQAA